ncbi:MAG: MATE family efflux transporter [Desulfobacterales bacterium]|nr:MATE family efflux transporter [Desulfobacterales bacterium]
MVSVSTTMVMEFTDRVFLARYSLDTIAAAMPAGITAFLFIVFFQGVASYANVFIAQYTGSGAPRRIGAVLWQGIYFSILAAVVLAGLSMLAAPLFAASGHPAEIQHLEIVYFRVLLFGAGLNVLGTAFSCFFSGQGLTRAVMVVHLVGTLFNVPLDYALINGAWFFPELGILGAGLATVSAWALVALLFGLLIFTKENERRFQVRGRQRFEPDLFFRLMRFGIPGSVQFCMDVFGFAFFIFMVGRIGKTELAVTNMVMSINSLAFMPMMGMSLGTSTLVGQALGAGRPETAVETTRLTLHLVFAYISVLLLVFVLLPEPLLHLFQPRGMDGGEFEKIVGIGVILLRLVAVYIFFDAQYMVYVGVLKGAGDTRFIMWSIGSLSLLVMALPIWIMVHCFHAGIFPVWGCVLAFIFSLFAVSRWRYRTGRWKEIRLIGASP